MRSILVVAFFLLIVSTSSAQDPKANSDFVADFCASDAEACRQLAVEIARIEIIRKTGTAVEPYGALVCSPDNAAFVAPACAAFERLLIGSALFEVHPEDWDWTDGGVFDHCWRPLGCTDILTPPVLAPPEWWPPVPDCNIVNVSAGWIISWCWAPGTFTTAPPPASPPSPELVRHLQDQAVRLEAATALRDELAEVLGAVEEEVRSLGGGN